MSESNPLHSELLDDYGFSLDDYLTIISDRNEFVIYASHYPNRPNSPYFSVSHRSIIEIDRSIIGQYSRNVFLPSDRFPYFGDR